MRHLRPQCSACVYWVIDPATNTATAGHCHRYPPLVFANPATGTIVQKYPMTDHHQWCGEWQADDAALVSGAREAIKRHAQEKLSALPQG